MNKSGQVMIYGIMVFLLVFIVAVVITEPMVEFVNIGRDADHLDCENTTISTGQRLTCIIIDIQVPYFIATILASAAGFLVITRGK